MNRTDTSPNTMENQSTADQVFEQAREGASAAVDTGEQCVRKNPIPAVATALIGGILLGVLIGWGAAEARQHQHRTMMRDRAAWWKRRLHLD